MSTVDPVPAEIRERIERAREARNVAVHAAASADYVAYLRAVTAAERELAAAYKAAYEAVPFSYQTLRYALLDAHFALANVVVHEEHEANEHERKQTDRTAYLEQS